MVYNILYNLITLLNRSKPSMEILFCLICYVLYYLYFITILYQYSPKHLYNEGVLLKIINIFK